MGEFGGTRQWAGLEAGRHLEETGRERSVQIGGPGPDALAQLRNPLACHFRAQGAIARQPETLGVFLDEVKRAGGADRHLDRAVADLESTIGALDPADTDALRYRARRIVGDMAMVLQGSLLVRFGHPAAADAFTASRLGGEWGDVFGTLAAGIDTRSIIERATPKISSR